MDSGDVKWETPTALSSLFSRSKEMTIEQAILQLKLIHSELSTPGREKDWRALLLGIEALRRLASNRKRSLEQVYGLLSGETED